MSMWSASCYLISSAVLRDPCGVPKTSEARRRVPCNVFSMSASSYYAARSAGLHPDAVLQIRKAAYRGERIVEYNGRRLTVERVDEGADFVKLTLAEEVGERGKVK